jgi:aminoglycoside phosphotransferase (APT) family kinase protein
MVASPRYEPKRIPVDAASLACSDPLVRLHADEVAVDVELARALIASQFPPWSSLDLMPVGSTGTDSVIFRLGDRMGVRFPRIESAVDQVHKEFEWLPVVASDLSVDVPQPVARGAPGLGYPWPWLVYGWLDGQSALEVHLDDEAPFAADIADFLLQLRRLRRDRAPIAGERAGPLARCDQHVRSSLETLHDEVDVGAALQLWRQALAAPRWTAPPVWVHGDLLPGNLLVSRGRLSGVIDWAATGLGDPACDLMCLWALGNDAREAVRAATRIDDATWIRGKGWVLQQAVMFIPYYRTTLPNVVDAARQRLLAVLGDGRKGPLTRSS